MGWWWWGVGGLLSLYLFWGVWQPNTPGIKVRVWYHFHGGGDHNDDGEGGRVAWAVNFIHVIHRGSFITEHEREHCLFSKFS